jgi:chromosome condensin MukBEF MukE localization factor
MKKVILSIALAASGIFTSTSVQAANTVNTTNEKPIIEVTFDDDGFVDVKFEELNEKVQAAINALKETYDIDVIKYNAEKQITKVKVTNKEDQSQKKIYFDNEGVETTWEEPVKDIEQETKTEEVL